MFKRRPAPERRPPVAGIKHLFHGIAIKPADDCKCSAVSAYEGKRLLSDEAPSLPLAGCDTPHSCKCVYQHFDDRRTAMRRESDVGLPPKEQIADRRMQTPRRITDG